LFYSERVRVGTGDSEMLCMFFNLSDLQSTYRKLNGCTGEDFCPGLEARVTDLQR